MHSICQRNPEKLKEIGDAFKIDKRFTKFEDMLKDPELDAVHINSPIPDHAPMTLAALKAGKHVSCTVPMATSVEDCKKIVELVKQTGLKYMMAETVVYSREFLFVKELYEKGRTGQDPVPAGQPSAGHGRLAQLLARPAADALRHPLRRPLPGPDPRRRGSRLLLRLRNHPQRAHRPIQLPLRHRNRPRQVPQLRRHRPRHPVPLRHRPAIPGKLRRVRRQEIVRVALDRRARIRSSTRPRRRNTKSPRA